MTGAGARAAWASSSNVVELVIVAVTIKIDLSSATKLNRNTTSLS